MITWYRVIIFVAVLVLAGIFLLSGDQSIESLVNYIQALPEPQASIVAVLSLILGTVLLVPSSILFISTGLLFGPVWGTFLNAMGFLIGSSLTFLIARYIARDFIVAHANQRIVHLIDEVGREGWRAVAILRVIPGFPSFLINYVLGVTSIHLTSYAWASLAFLFPAMAVLTYVGATGRAMLEGESPLMQILTAVGLVIAALIISQILKRRIGRRFE